MMDWTLRLPVSHQPMTSQMATPTGASEAPSNSPCLVTSSVNTKWKSYLQGAQLWGRCLGGCLQESVEW